MPTQVYKIHNASGGLNSQGDTAGIKDNEATNLTSFTPDRRGRLRLSGKMNVHQITYDTKKGSGDDNDSIDLSYVSTKQNSGTGLFYFRSDNPMLSADNTYVVNGDSELGESLGGVEYWVVADNRYIKIYDSTKGRWLQTLLVAGGSDITTDGGPRHIYYYGNNALRVSAAHTLNVGGTSFHRRWLGFIERTLFGGGGDYTAWRNHKRWYQDTAKILPPSGSSYSQTVGSEVPGKMASNFVDISGDDVSFTGTGKEGMHFEIGYDAPVTGTWEAKSYTFYGSYIYDGSQESNVFSLGSRASSADKKLHVGIICNYSSDDNVANAAATNDGIIADAAGLEVNARITGGRLYFSDPDDGDGILYHMLDFDFANGCRKVGEESWTAWDALSESNHETYECPDGVIANLNDVGFVFEDPPKFVTYETINGYKPFEDLNPEFNCAAMVGKRMYIGNVKVNGTVFNDRILRSPVNFEGKPQYDTFPETHFLEVGADDGDTIIELVSDGDKLIVFKEGSVSVLNVGRFGGEYIENTFQYVGIKHRCQVVKTQYGVCWVTNVGCYMLQQNNLINLIEGKIATSGEIKNYQKYMSWTVSDTSVKYMPAIGYLPKEEKILIAINIHPDAIDITSRHNDCWMYDFKEKSWSYHVGSMATNLFRSNFVNDHNGALYQTGATIASGTASDDDKQLFFWNTSSSDKAEARYVTKDINFGDPDLVKKVYKVGLTFKTDTTTNMKAYYGIDGSDDIMGTFEANKGTLSSSIITADSTALSPELVKYNSNGVWYTANGGNNYLANMSYISDGGVSSGKTYMQKETDVLADNWTLSASGLSIAGADLLYDGGGDTYATYTFGTAQAIRTSVIHVLTFTIKTIATNMTVQIIGIDLEGGSNETMASPSQYTSTGVKTVTFSPAENHTAYQIKFVGASSAGNTTIDTIEMYANMGAFSGLYNDSPSIMMGTFGSANGIAGFSTMLQGGGGSSNHFIRVSASERHQLNFFTNNVMYDGGKVRLIDMGTSTELPDLGAMSTYDASGSVPQSIPLSGSGIDGTSADYASITEAYTQYSLNTVSALNTSNNYYIVFSIDSTDTEHLHWISLTQLSLKKLGNWHTGFLNLSSPVSCKSFQLMLENSGTAHASFQLRDVSIYYRPLRPRITDG